MIGTFEPSLCNRSYRNDEENTELIGKNGLNQAFVIEVIETNRSNIARENNNKFFSDIFGRKPYTILSEIKDSKALIKTRIETKVVQTGCAIM